MVKCGKNSDDNTCRTFKISYSSIGFVSPTNQYYKGKEPNVVARKFGTMLFKLSTDPLGNKYKFRKDNTMQIKLKETTRGSQKKEYDYTLEKIELETPQVRVLPDGTKLITTNEIKATKFVSNSSGGGGSENIHYNHNHNH
tara:strand:- start:314 stop:736 length:423 start_codon:yes stop_codon:yes gene_type:complete